MEHYRFYTVYFNKIIVVIIVDTVEFPPENNKISLVSNQEAATNVALDLIEDIKNLTTTAPFASIRNRQLQKICNLADIFKQTT